MHTICLDARMFFSGGIGTYIRNLIPFVAEKFHLQLLVHPDRGLPPHLARYETIPVKADIYSMREQIELPLVIPSCDLFWAPHYNVPLMPLRAKKKVVTIHDVYHLAFASSLTLLERTYAKVIMGRAIATAHRVITVSSFSAKELLRYTRVAPKQLAMIHSGIESHLFLVQRAPSRRYFLFVGNFKPHKNLKGILAAFRLFLMQEQADLLLVGKRQGLRNQEDLATLLATDPVFKERVHILENVSNEQLPSLYANAEALLFPSFYEGFGFPPLEAMACGCPVIVSDIEVLREVCQEATHFVNPLNPQEIRDKMLEVWRGRDPQKQQRGKAWAASFSWENSANRHIELFEALCK